VKRLALIALMLAVSAGASAQESPNARALAALQGKWQVVSITANGQPMSFGASLLVMSIDGNKYEQSVDGVVDERGTFTIDATKTPMTIDFTIMEPPAPNKTQLGIFEITGDTVKFHVAMSNVTVRPPSFAPAPAHLVITGKKK
jgi:uncharacterized protein (TIGR03067 family)